MLFTTSTGRTREYDVRARDATDAAVEAVTRFTAEDADGTITHLLVRILGDDRL